MKDFAYYEDLPYHAVWEHVATADGDWYWQVRLREIPTVAGIGTTEDEALEELRERFAEYVCLHLDEGLEIPEPDGAPPPTKPGGEAARDGHGGGDGGNGSHQGGGRAPGAGSP